MGDVLLGLGGREKRQPEMRRFAHGGPSEGWGWGRRGGIRRRQIRLARGQKVKRRWTGWPGPSVALTWRTRIVTSPGRTPKSAICADAA